MTRKDFQLIATVLKANSTSPKERTTTTPPPPYPYTGIYVTLYTLARTARLDTRTKRAPNF